MGGPPIAGPQYEMDGVAPAFISNHKPEENTEIAQKLYARATG